MKTISILIWLLVVWLVMWHVWWVRMSNVPHPVTTVKEKKWKIDIVQMPAQIIARVTTAGTVTNAPYEAFWSLAGYIFGDNTKADKIAMTAPVTSHVVGENIAMTAPVTAQQNSAWQVVTSFIMPEKWTIETLPVPNNPAVIIEEIPGKIVAVRTFSGYAASSRVAKQRERFQQELNEQNIERTGTMTLAQYNDPRTPPRLRRNELWVELAK